MPEPKWLEPIIIVMMRFLEFNVRLNVRALFRTRADQPTMAESKRCIDLLGGFPDHEPRLKQTINLPHTGKHDDAQNRLAGNV